MAKASEFGQLFGGRPVLITTLQDAPAGRDGAVSLRGVSASIIGGGLIGMMGFSKRSFIAGAGENAYGVQGLYLYINALHSFASFLLLGGETTTSP